MGGGGDQKQTLALNGKAESYFCLKMAALAKQNDWMISFCPFLPDRQHSNIVNLTGTSLSLGHIIAVVTLIFRKRRFAASLLDLPLSEGGGGPSCRRGVD